MNKLTILFGVLIFLFVSCDSGPKRTAPTILLSESQMVDVMTDVQIMEATISYKKNVNQKTAYLKTTGYDTLFAHYGITDSIFRENVKYYNDVEPQTLVKIMEAVEARIAKMSNQ